jgi:hypothetical protein
MTQPAKHRIRQAVRAFISSCASGCYFHNALSAARAELVLVGGSSEASTWNIECR